MQYQHIGHKIKGFYHIAKYATRHLAMLSDKAKHKQKVLQFWDKHGLKATLDAFGLSRRTLFLWKKQKHTGEQALEEKSKRPHHLRSRKWPGVIVKEIQRLREAYPNLGKEKLYSFLKPFCEACQLKCPSSRTIGRLIADNPHKMRFIPKRLNIKGQFVIREKRPK